MLATSVLLHCDGQEKSCEVWTSISDNFGRFFEHASLSLKTHVLLLKLFISPFEWLKLPTLQLFIHHVCWLKSSWCFFVLNPHLYWQNQPCLACKSNLCCFNSLCFLLNIPELAYLFHFLWQYLHSFQSSESPEPQWITLRIWKFIISTWWIDQLKKWWLYSSQSVVQSFPYRTNPFLYPLCVSCWLIPLKIQSHGTILWYSGGLEHGWNISPTRLGMMIQSDEVHHFSGLK